ncbi:hypothetical protein EVAR_81365_1, partial [Eumeta japonica]
MYHRPPSNFSIINRHLQTDLPDAPSVRRRSVCAAPTPNSVNGEKGCTCEDAVNVRRSTVEVWCARAAAGQRMRARRRYGRDLLLPTLQGTVALHTGLTDEDRGRKVIYSDYPSVGSGPMFGNSVGHRVLNICMPGACLSEEDNAGINPAALRRRAEARWRECGARAPADSLPENGSVVRRTREELARAAARAGEGRRRPSAPLDGWAKVEEVRKKFEGAAAVPAYSRSFESPPRRRLADSLFASFKLPRRKEGMAQPRATQAQPKRKSAVELLAETKAFYVKSETVLDRKQELPLRMSSGLGQAIAAGGCHLVSSGTVTNDCCNPYGTVRVGAVRRPASAGDGLQNTLRRLLEHSDSRENVHSPPIYAVQTRRLKDGCVERDAVVSRSQHTSGTFSGTSSSGTSGSKPQIKSDPEHGRDIPKGPIHRPLSFGDARVFFPESFVIPRQKAREVVLKHSYCIPSSHSSPENIELPDPVLSPEGETPCEEIAAISPPAQYAHSTHSRYIRSNSHSQPSMREEETCTNINSHKSLPDLHMQVRCYTDQVNRGTDTIGRSPRRRRHSAHQRTASCSSKGTRSNHSSLVSSCEAFSEHPSPGEENYQYNSRCGSSFARDSGGSSGHYTQRSAPPHAQPRPTSPRAPHRTDSGSSTQHSHNRFSSYYGGEGLCAGAGATEWQVSAPPQFQDGAPSPPPHPPPRYTDTLVGIHFQASAPPPQFQDEPPAYDAYEYECAYKAPVNYIIIGRAVEYTIPRNYNRYHEASSEMVNKQPQYQELRPRSRPDDTQDYNTTQVCTPEEITSPLGTFKRQRCLRYKQRRPRPILRSKSDVSD